jgi:hypothetical protein
MPEAARHWLFRALDRRHRQQPRPRLPELELADRLGLDVNRLRRQIESRDGTALNDRYYLLDGPRSGHTPFGSSRAAGSGPPRAHLLKDGQISVQAEFHYFSALQSRPTTFKLYPPWFEVEPMHWEFPEPAEEEDTGGAGAPPPRDARQ